MARRGKGGLGLGPMALIVGVVLGLVVTIALYAIVPTIGYTIASSYTIPATSVWGNNTAGSLMAESVTNASDLWASTSGLPVLAVLAIILGAAIYYFMGI